MKLTFISDIITLALCETDARGFAQIAQLVEQRTENPCVTGSNPVDATPRAETQQGFGSFLFLAYPPAVALSKQVKTNSNLSTKKTSLPQ